MARRRSPCAGLEEGVIRELSVQVRCGRRRTYPLGQRVRCAAVINAPRSPRWRHMDGQQIDGERRAASGPRLQEVEPRRGQKSHSEDCGRSPGLALRCPTSPAVRRWIVRHRGIAREVDLAVASTRPGTGSCTMPAGVRERDRRGRSSRRAATRRPTLCGRAGHARVEIEAIWLDQKTTVAPKTHRNGFLSVSPQRQLQDQL